MKRILILPFLFAIISITMFNQSHAVLTDRGSGLIYDTDLDITWLQNVGLADHEKFGVSGISTSGYMNWNVANDWIDAMNAASYLGFNDWRLPATLDGPLVYGFDGTTTAGWNITTSELGYMFHITLGNVGYYAKDGTGPQPGWGSILNLGPFTNVSGNLIWSGTEYSIDTELAWYYGAFSNGYQDAGDKSRGFNAWPVRDGDVYPKLENYHYVPSPFYPTIQSAIDTASDGEVILVEDGTYTGEGNKNLDFKGKAITVKSRNGPDKCSIDCQGAETAFFLHTEETPASVIDGFRIQNCIDGVKIGGMHPHEGSASTIKDCIISDCQDNGINIRYSKGTIISDCTIRDNQENGISTVEGSITISNCYIEKNQRDGIYLWECSSPTIIGCTIKENQRNGINLSGCNSPTITNCTLTDNLTRGIEVEAGWKLNINNCIVSRNLFGITAANAHDGEGIITDCIISEHQYSGVSIGEATYTIANSIISKNNHSGIAAGLDSTTIVRNCIISDNTNPSDGGGINAGYRLMVTNSTISRNTGQYGGGISTRAHNESDVRITNTILWGNSPLSQPELGGLATITYSDIDQDGYEGINGNIRQDPLFADPSNGDYNLTKLSPCKDSGDNNAPELPNTDKNGNPRIMDHTVDMGAYEYPGNQDTPVANDMDVNTDEDTPVDIILEVYDKDLMYEFTMDKTGNYNNVTAKGDAGNFPEPSSEHAEGVYSAYFETVNNEYLNLDDNDATFDLPWKHGTNNKTGTIWFKFKSPEINDVQYLFGKYNIGDDKRTIAISVRPSPDGIRVNLGYDNGESYIGHSHGGPIKAETWYAVCVCFEQNSGNSGDPEKIYIEARSLPDGNVVGTNYVANAFEDPDNDELNLNDTPYIIGAALDSTSMHRPFEGHIDDVMIFNEKMVGNDFEQYASGAVVGDPACILDFEHTPLTFSIESEPSNGSLSGTPPNVVYTPDDDFYGDDSFTFTANDGYADSNVATVNITVDPVNDNPLITGQLSLDTESGIALEITLDDLLVTDIDSDYPDDFSIHVQPGSNYTLDGNIITPDADFTGVLVVPVNVNDGDDDSNTYNLNVTVGIFDACPGDPDKIDPGICGCGIPDVDSDNDGTLDCNDNCPNDENKIEPGICGCGITDTDSDLDGTVDCNDSCPEDPEKTLPGVCGCGVSDIDGDEDGTPDCLDDCDSNVDTDGDGTGDCDESCPNDPNKTEPGICGCGIADVDTDNDLVLDCLDNCPNDPDKTEPGICGCGTSDIDSDGDGTSDCNDNCPNDSNKIQPDICGCGIPEIFSDDDDAPDCIDQCPTDPNKVELGVCGCGVPDTDSDSDGTPDCDDDCLNDPNKVLPGQCGCGTPETDSDSDGTPDCLDNCENDPNKIDPGACGCGVPDIDTDNDGTSDCIDNCPNDPNKINPGVCGCGVSDIDTDGDGTLDCNDGCLNDPNKIAPGICGCGVADIDSDNDGTLDCNDECPNDSDKIAEGICGCGVAETDTDNDGTPDCIDTKPIAVIISPNSDHTITAGESVDFRCTVANGNEPFTYSWDFDGAAENSTQQEPGDVTFSEIGTYNVTLAVIDNDGDSDNDTVTVTVSETSPLGDDGGGDDGGGGGCFISLIH
jgi:parallel beta-helix repeat protein